MVVTRGQRVNAQSTLQNQSTDKSGPKAAKDKHSPTTVSASDQSKQKKPAKGKHAEPDPREIKPTKVKKVPIKAKAKAPPQKTSEKRTDTEAGIGTKTLLSKKLNEGDPAPRKQAKIRKQKKTNPSELMICE